MSGGGLVFKIDSEPEEFEQIHRLNYRTFVEEIPQHAVNAQRRLVDAFHDENTYIICLKNGTLAGMLSVRAKRPFSLDRKLPDLDRRLPPASSVCEIRLLAVTPSERRGPIFAGLLRELLRLCDERGHDLAIISGTVRQAKLYRHLGFRPFGPLVGTPEAPYQPMYLTWDALRAAAPRMVPTRRT